MVISDVQSVAIGTKIAKSWKNFYSWEMKVLRSPPVFLLQSSSLVPYL